MANVMLSYSRKDAHIASAMASALEGFGMKVWWDIALSPGKTFAREIDTIIREVDHVVVLWSPNSVDSEWVVAEASLAKDLGKLVPVKIADCETIVNFRTLHTPNAEWIAQQERFENLDFVVSRLLEAPGEATAQESWFTEYELSCVPSKILVSQTLRRRTWDQIEKEGEANNILARWLFGAALLDGIGMPAAPVRGAEIIAECASKGLDRALHSQGMTLIEGLGVKKDITAGVEFVKEAATRGVGLSQWLLGVWLLRGTHMAKDENAAFRTLHKAALQGHLAACAEVGECFRQGQGTIKDSKEALFWLESAAGKGETFALKMLAAIAADGEFPGKGDDYAARQFEAAYHAGDVSAALSLGRFYTERQRKTYDIRQAASWYKRAGDAGKAEGHYQAALIIMNAAGALNDVADPIWLLARAADEKHKAALVKLGEALLNPKFGRVNKKDARDAFDEALRDPQLEPELRRSAESGKRRASSFF